MPLFSLAVTVYNLEKYIGKCLESILTQDFDDYEVIVADNGSTDKSVEICEFWQKAYPDKMKFIKFPPPTIFGRAAGAAFAETTGEYVHVIDGDDYVAEGYLKNLAEIIKAKKSDLIIGSFIGISEDGEIAFKDVDICTEKINNVSHFEALKYIFSLPHINRCLWRYVVKKSLFGFTKGSCPDLTKTPVFADGTITANWMFTAKSMAYYSGPFYYHRRREGSVTFFRNSDMSCEFFRIVLEYQRFINKIRKRNKQYCELLLPNLIWHFKLVIADYDLVNYDGLLIMEQAIINQKETFQSLAKHNSGIFKKPTDLVRQYGGAEGLMMFFEWERTHFTVKLKDVRDHEIYVFPTGRYGEGTARLLRDRGFHVKGFLDNDKTKSGVEFQGIPCYLPESLRSMTPEQKEKTAVVIATIYEKLIPVLKKQLMDDGVSEEKIFIRD